MGHSRHTGRLLNAVIFLLPFAAAIVCIGIGRYHLSPLESFRVLAAAVTGGEVEATAWSVVINVRLPRILLALSVGAGLAVSGACVDYRC